jgi:hypothetical protein
MMIVNTIAEQTIQRRNHGFSLKAPMPLSRCPLLPAPPKEKTHP